MQDVTRLDHAVIAFDAYEKMLRPTTALGYIDRKRSVSLILYTNPWAYGAAACQEFDEVLHPVRLYSKVFQDNERGYLPAEKESLALVKTLNAPLELVRAPFGRPTPDPSVTHMALTWPGPGHAIYGPGRVTQSYFIEMTRT